MCRCAYIIGLDDKMRSDLTLETKVKVIDIRVPYALLEHNAGQVRQIGIVEVPTHDVAHRRELGVCPLVVGRIGRTCEPCISTGLRTKKDFATGDKIRNSLTEAGITLEDRKGGATEWRVGQ